MLFMFKIYWLEMDNRQSDRHKGPRNYQTGNEKRKKNERKTKATIRTPFTNTSID